MRVLNNFKVHCSNKKLGCQWVGELEALANHVKSNPSRDKQLEGCPFTEVQCLHCSKSVQRSNIEVHQNDQCVKRPVSCEYCNDYDSTYKDVITNHWPKCVQYPVQCPNECGNETIKRQNINSHVINDCPLTIVDCDFKGFGCDVRVSRKDLPTHLTESQIAHISLQVDLLVSQNQQMNLDLIDLKEENKRLQQETKQAADLNNYDKLKLKDQDNQLKQEVAERKVENKKMKEEVMKELTALKEDNMQLKQQVERLTKYVLDYQTQTPLCPIDLTMPSFEKLKKSGAEWHSPPFYTHPMGYTLRLMICAGGHRGGKGTHISVYVKLMRGEYDDLLGWPLRGKFAIQLSSQKGEDKWHIETIAFDDKTPDAVCSRVKSVKAQADDGYGLSKFASLAELKPTYLEDDCLKFRVNYSKV